MAKLEDTQHGRICKGMKKYVQEHPRTSWSRSENENGCKKKRLKSSTNFKRELGTIGGEPGRDPYIIGKPLKSSFHRRKE